MMSLKQHHLGFIDLFLLSLRVFRTRPARTALTILGMGFGVGVVLFLVSLGYGLQFILLGNLASTQDSLVALETYYPSESKLLIDEPTLAKVHTLPHVSEISTVAEYPAEAKTPNASGYLVSRIVDAAYLRLAGTSIETRTTGAASVTTQDVSGNVIVSKSALTVLGLPPNTTAAASRRSRYCFAAGASEGGASVGGGGGGGIAIIDGGTGSAGVLAVCTAALSSALRVSPSMHAAIDRQL